jgi:hypothetical protein
MKVIGLVGGLSWESTAEYYRLINEAVKAQRGGLHSAKRKPAFQGSKNITAENNVLHHNSRDYYDGTIDGSVRSETSSSLHLTAWHCDRRSLTAPRSFKASPSLYAIVDSGYFRFALTDM